MRRNTGRLGYAMAAGGLAILLIALLPLAAVVVFFARGALLLLALVAAVALLALWLTSLEGRATVTGFFHEGRAS